MSTKPVDTSHVIYHPPRSQYSSMPTSSIKPLGIDTEAYDDGKCFLICTSEGDSWTPDMLPGCLFDRQHRDRSYVAYNLKYDMGAILQHLSEQDLQILRKYDKVTVGEYRYRVIANKFLGITKGHKSIQIYDMLNFYQSSLEVAAQKYLGEGKDDIETKTFTKEYVRDNLKEIEKYCIKDAVLVALLAERLITQFEQWGLKVKKLYSTASVSYAWFSHKSGHPSVGHLWRFNRQVLDYAMSSYTGGKFEVTKKGVGYFYEYDLSSAYPHSIRNLVGLNGVRVVWSNRYRRYAAYGFIDCTIRIPLELPSPVAIKRGYVNTYPSGTFRKIITKVEYEYLINGGADVQIHNAAWLHVDKKTYPYRKEIDRLYKLKAELKDTGDKLGYHTVKILMNSLYGKFVQLIEQGDYWRAGASWNPIFASEITARTRVKMCQLQREYPSVWAVHTDSVISDEPLPFQKTTELGALSYEIEGKGLIAACGVYQIGDKTALRGVSSPIPLVDLVSTSGKVLSTTRVAPHTWRQVLASGWDTERINRFEEQVHELLPNADRKRIWIDDVQLWRQLLNRQVLSTPYEYSRLFYPEAG